MGGKDEEDFERNFARFRPQILRFFANRGFSHEDSLELTQETFLRAFRGFSGFKGESSFKTWIFQIAKNVYRNDVRDRRAEKRAGQEVPLNEVKLDPAGGKEALEVQESCMSSPGGDPLKAMIQEESLALLRLALKKLPPRMRRCMFLRVYQERDYREIAVLMQLEIGTVKSQLHQARRRLRDELGDYFCDFDFD